MSNSILHMTFGGLVLEDRKWERGVWSWQGLHLPLSGLYLEGCEPDSAFVNFLYYLSFVWKPTEGNKFRSNHKCPLPPEVLKVSWTLPECKERTISLPGLHPQELQDLGLCHSSGVLELIWAFLGFC